MRTIFWATVVAAALVGCGSSNDDDNNNNPPAGPGTGLKFQIQSATVPTSGNPTVTFLATDAAGTPLDVVADMNSGVISSGRIRFTLAELQADDEWEDLFENTSTGKAFFLNASDTTATQPEFPTAVQAASVTLTAAAIPQQLTAQGNGVYTFTFSTPTNTTASIDRSRTFRVGMWAQRTAAGETTATPASATFDFVPAGGTPTQREIVSDTGCSTCHQPLVTAHDNRQGVQLCETCHNSMQSVPAGSHPNVDPDSGNTILLATMVHKIHRGSALTEKPYFIVGYDPQAATNAVTPASSVTIFSDNPPVSVHCTTCHQGAQGDNWKNDANVDACITCHDYVRFQEGGLSDCSLGAAGQGIESTPCKHANNISATANCSGCHTATAAGIGVVTNHPVP